MKRTVLLVEDEPIVRRVTTMILEEAGFVVVTASDGPEAVAAFRERGEEISAALLDLELPGLAGDHVLEELRALRADLPAVLSTGQSIDDLRARVSSLHRLAFVQKPYASDELLAKLNQVLGAPLAGQVE